MRAFWSPDAPWPPPPRRGPAVPAPVPRTPPIPLTERHIELMQWRIKLLRHREVPEQRAEQLADLLAYRDRERDDRRMCLECSEWQLAGTCAVVMDGRFRPCGVKRGTEHHFRPLPDVLQRCPNFKWEKGS